MEITLDYKPHNGQKIIHSSKARFRVLVCGRRWGKTLCAANECIVQATKGKDKIVWIVSPTYAQSMISWRMLKKILVRTPLVKKFHVSDSYIEFVNGSEIYIKSADNPDNLRGSGLDFLVMDEAAMISQAAWSEVLRPALADKMGGALFISTPKGLNWFYETFLIGQDPKYAGKWASWQFPTSSNPFIQPDELKEVEENTASHIWRQEYLAEFLIDSGEVFRNIQGCISTTSLSDPKPDERYIMGVDLARYNDWTVLIVLDSARNIVFFDRFTDTAWSLQKSRIISTAKRYNNAKIILDRTGIGQPIWEDLATREDLNITGFNISGNKEKAKLIENLVLSIERAKIHWENTGNLLNLTKELKFFQMERLPSGTLRYSAPDGYTDDCVLALSLAEWGITTGANSEWAVKDIGSYFDHKDKYTEMVMVM